MRRVLDVTLSSVGLGVLALPMALIALVILTTMGRPILYRQQRCGMRCRPFVMLKFRTMSEACDAQGLALPDERRLTRLGRFLRRFRLDELPELWNVLRGDMSLIGPRPLLPGAFAAQPGLWSRRNSVRPGLTGWAQVNGNTRLDLATKVALDLWYIDHACWRLDLLILWKTLVMLLVGERIDERSVREATRLCGRL